MSISLSKQKLWVKLLSILFVVAVLLCFVGVSDALAEDQIVFKYDGSDSVTYTRTDLTNDFDSQQLEFSAVNNWPTKKFYVADGVYLEDIVFDYLDTIDEDWADVTLITVKATDNLTKTFTKDELLCQDRYYYPNIMSDSTTGAADRFTVIALESAESDDFEDLSTSDGLRLIMGQRYITEQNNPWMVKNVCEINLQTTTPDQWADPTASPGSGTFSGSVQVTLNHTYINGVKLYYTLDGSTPTVNSAMYNVSATYYQPELNVPITLTQTTTIKVIAIGPGKTNSNVVSFTYTKL